MPLPTLGGVNTHPFAVNSAREVVGLSTLSNGTGVPFFWTQTLGIRQLPATGGYAFAVSDPRADGTRLAAGFVGAATVWVVRTP